MSATRLTSNPRALTGHFLPATRHRPWRPCSCLCVPLCTSSTPSVRPNIVPDPSRLSFHPLHERELGRRGYLVGPDSGSDKRSMISPITSVLEMGSGFPFKASTSHLDEGEAGRDRFRSSCGLLWVCGALSQAASSTRLRRATASLHLYEPTVRILQASQHLSSSPWSKQLGWTVERKSSPYGGIFPGRADSAHMQ